MIPKFRAFLDGEMVHNAAKVGNTLYWNDGKCFDVIAFKQPNPAILMQYIGFKDKHDISIYTGDILTDDYGRAMEVEWRVYRFRFKALTETNFTYAHQLGEWFEIDDDFPEIIGNIYENPDFMEKFQ